MSDTEWFPHATEATAHDALFMQRLREHAIAWSRLGLSPERSDALEVAVPFLGVELPHLTTDVRWLWIIFTHDDGRSTAECRWGDEDHFDDVGPIDGNLDVHEPARAQSTEHRAQGAERIAERVSRWVAGGTRRSSRRLGPAAALHPVGLPRLREGNRPFAPSATVARQNAEPKQLRMFRVG